MTIYCEVASYDWYLDNQVSTHFLVHSVVFKKATMYFKWAKSRISKEPLKQSLDEAG